MARISRKNTLEKKKNISYIKHLIFSHSPISRVEIADMLGLTQAAISNNVNLLIDDGLIHEIQLDENPGEGTVGRRPIMLEFISDSKYVIGIEINPYGIYLTVLNACGQVIYSKENSVNQVGNGNSDYDYNNVLQEMANLIETAIKECKLPKKKVAGIGISLPGFIDHHEGIIIKSIWTNWDNKNLVKDMSELVDYEICINNNVTIRAFSEAFLKNDRPSTFVYLYVSRGISCPLVKKKSNLDLEVVGTGEIGHMVVDVNGIKCQGCGDKGCLETYSGEKAIRKRCAEEIARNKNSILKEIVSNPQSPTIYEIITAANQGDSTVNEILDKAMKYLSAGICNIIKFINPELVIVDAYLMKLESLKDILQNYVNEHLEGYGFNKVTFEFKEHDRFGGAKGSASYALKKFIIDA